MTRLLVQILLILGFLYAPGMNIAAQRQPEFTILYTLGDEEILHYGELHASLYGSGKNFAAVIEETYNGTYYLIFNGESIYCGEEILIGYLNVEEPLGYCIYFKEGDDHYLNLKGDIKGPYDYIRTVDRLWDNELRMAGNSDFAHWFAYRLAYDDRWWVSDGPETVPTGPFEDVDVFCTRDGRFGYGYKLYGQWYEVTGDKITGPYDFGTPNMRQGETDGEDFVFTYRRPSSDGVWINYNHQQLGPFPNIWSINLQGGNFAYCYNSEYNDYRANVNGKEFGPYIINPRRYKFGGPGKFVFQAQGPNERYYVVNGQQYGPYSWTYSERDICHLSANGNFIYGYSLDYGDNYLNVNGETISTGDKEVVSVVIEDSGNYAWSYRERSGDYYVIIGGKRHGPFDGPGGYINIRTNGDKYMYGYQQAGSFYMCVNGENFGPYSGLKFEEEYSHLGADGSFSFCFNDDKYRIYLCRDGEVSLHPELNRTAPPFSRNRMGKFDDYGDTYVVLSPDGRHKIEAHWAYSYVDIDGTTYGSASPLNMWYNADKNSFVWIGTEQTDEMEMSLVRYEFTLDE